MIKRSEEEEEEEEEEDGMMTTRAHVACRATTHSHQVRGHRLTACSRGRLPQGLHRRGGGVCYSQTVSEVCSCLDLRIINSLGRLISL